MLRSIPLLASLGLALVFAPASPASARISLVRPGQSIQAAVDGAAAGDTIFVLPGVYHESGSPCPTDASHTCAVVVTKERISLVGIGLFGRGPVLEAVSGQDQGIAVARSGADGVACLTDASQRLHGSKVQGLVVAGFAGEGIFHFCVDGFDVRGNVTRDNGEYGIFPSHCAHGRVVGNLATGSNDTGIYIGQSSDVTITDNVARGNVSGFEIENSTGVVLERNLAVGNTGGILSFTLPFLDAKVNDGNRIAHNFVLSNNKPNTCLDPSDAVCAVPPGTGILLVAADHNQVEANLVLGNDSFGIAVSNFCLAQQIPDPICAQLDIQPDSDGSRVAQNVVLGNGTSPAASLPPMFAVDLAWDTTGAGNCWDDNHARTQFPDVLPSCP